MKKVLVLLLGLVFFNTSAQKMSPSYLEDNGFLRKELK